MPAFADLLETGDAADAVDMTGHDVPAQTVARAQRFLQVDRARSGQAGRLVQ
jgi:hypothetical protein